MDAAAPAPTAPVKGLGDRIVRASMAVAIAHLTFKVVGLVQAIVVGRYLDDATFDAIYVFAFEGIIWAVFFRLGEETIGPCLLPVFMKEKDERGEAAAWSFANIVLSLQTVLLSVVVLLIMLFPEWIIELGTSWTQSDKPKQFELARHSLVWIAPALLCLSLGSTTYMLLNGYKKFFLAAFGEASWKICVVVMLVIGIGIMGWGHWALIIGILIGSVACACGWVLGRRQAIGYTQDTRL